MILHDLAATVVKSLEVRVQRIGRSVGHERALDVGIEVQAHVVPILVLEHDIAEEIETGPERIGAGHRSPAELAAGLMAREVDLSGARVANVRIDRLDGRNLPRRQASRRIGAGWACERRRIEPALARILENAVRRAVMRVAGGQHGIMNQAELLGG